MSKVIMFSREFPAYHPKAGEYTFFMEKVVKSVMSYDRAWYDFNLVINRKVFKSCSPKHHTIRAGHRFKAGDKFSPRVWSGKPYRSKQIIIAPDIEVKQVWDIEMDSLTGNHHLWIGGSVFGYQVDVETLLRLTNNDGLESTDFKHWFIKSPEYVKTSHFDGQIICWNENIQY